VRLFGAVCMCSPFGAGQILPMGRAPLATSPASPTCSTSGTMSSQPVSRTATCHMHALCSVGMSAPCCFSYAETGRGTWGSAYGPP